MNTSLFIAHRLSLSQCTLLNGLGYGTGTKHLALRATIRNLYQFLNIPLNALVKDY